jgi:hypothetical protein
MGRIEKTVFNSYRCTNYPWALAFSPTSPPSQEAANPPRVCRNSTFASP